MAKKSSTGALSQEQKEAQDALYAEGHKYDYLVIGTGNSALSFAALMANAGKKVCMLEYHDIPGGYAQSFEMNDFYFCGQIHYTWGCGPGGRVYKFLEKLGLENELTFELYDPEGYDHMVMPDGKTVKIPYGWDKLAENIDTAYPGQKENVKKFTDILHNIRVEMGKFPQRKIQWWEYAARAWEFRHLIKYRKKTVQDVFDECGLSKEAQLVLIANAGDFMAPPERLSIFPFAGLFGGYNAGAYYPTKHFKGYIERIAQSITDHEGCHIYYETEATKINTEGDKVVSVETADGKVFTADTIVCNMDPQTAAKDLIGWDKFPEVEQKKLSYEYSPSGMVIYLGLKNDIDIREFGFGRHNVWHCTQWDMNKCWKEHAEWNFEKPWFFISTPNLHSDEPGTAPEGCQIMEIAAYCEFKELKDDQDKGYGDYVKRKLKLAERLLDLVEEYYIPDLRKHIQVKVVGTPTTNLDYCKAVKGNAYGSYLNPENFGAGRLRAKTPLSNFYWCNASSGYPGFYGTVNTGVQLYWDLTGDQFYDMKDIPGDDELVKWAQEHGKK